ncbi:hypothetical protein SAMN04487864_11522 [Succiniclasticum ruminis]|uniref:DUF6273 domain-containing protein n=1 Tax=Succiniclasticum ruminis TaxID=40841 RepID=A0A1G6NQ88_9FIRM|nr:DUF6273 domain-containing protein [Succiniclasticum ruminis]SDC69476.1 hypothetical protein SAMN04487864_11522 [Succiniclasticum ruminis]
MSDPVKDRIVTHDQGNDIIAKLQAIATALTNGFSNYLPLAGGTLTGTVNGVNPAATDNSTKLATTKYVKDNVPTSVGSGVKPVYTDSNGKIVASSSTVGGSDTPAYLDGGTITAAAKYVPVQNNAGYHNSVYRGKSLGSSVTAAQWASIKAGTFEDLFIGDYWTINSVNWRIAAFDYWLNCGDTNCTAHHVVIVPDSNLTSCKMNDTNITTGAYIGSDYYKGTNGNTGKATAQTAINNAFGSGHILNHREHLQNAVTNGYESAGTWYDSTFELMTERMVYGCDIFHNTMNGTNIPNWYSIDKSQLPLFALEPSRITNRANWWLRDVVSASNFANVNGAGDANHYGASNSFGVRPAFAIYQS